MKKLALAVVLIAFGAVMVAGCPTDNTKSNTKTDSNKSCGGGNANS